jgi:hypothetical protein
MEPTLQEIDTKYKYSLDWRWKQRLVYRPTLEIFRWIFTQAIDIWTQQAKLVGSDGTIVGNPGDDSNIVGNFYFCIKLYHHAKCILFKIMDK